jgi:hypothetical protein
MKCWCHCRRVSAECGHCVRVVLLPVLAARVVVVRSQRLQLPLSVNEKKYLVMHLHVQLKLDELRGPPTLGSL